ncbi:MAG: hypothetical protein HY059_17005 [Proteobacteria bacterium]|nr:hypothetical protein [Pseudomonadota bacterium]
MRKKDPGLRRTDARCEFAHFGNLFRDPPMGVQTRLDDATPVVPTSPFRVGDQINLKDGIATLGDSENAVRRIEALLGQRRPLFGRCCARQ